MTLKIEYGSGFIQKVSKGIILIKFISLEKIQY